MLSDGLTAKQADGSARAEVQVPTSPNCCWPPCSAAPADATTAAEPTAVDAGDPDSVTATPDVGAGAGASTAEAEEAVVSPAGGEADGGDADRCRARRPVDRRRRPEA